MNCHLHIRAFPVLVCSRLNNCTTTQAVLTNTRKCASNTTELTVCLVDFRSLSRVHSAKSLSPKFFTHFDVNFGHITLNAYDQNVNNRVRQRFSIPRTYRRRFSTNLCLNGRNFVSFSYSVDRKINSQFLHCRSNIAISVLFVLACDPDEIE